MSSPRAFTRLPETDSHYKKTKDYIEEIPDADYSKAPPESLEAFRDMKFAVRIHWGLYSEWELNGESWQFLGMPYAHKAEYMRLIHRFNPTAFDAEAWMQFFADSGLEAFTFTTKHHEGFSLFDTKTRVKKKIDWAADGGPQTIATDEAFSVMESPFKRDIVRELCDAARKKNIKIGLYFSHPDWYDADFAPYVYHPGITADYLELTNYEKEIRTPDGKTNLPLPAVTPAQEDRMVARHMGQLEELLTNYGEVFMLCLDMWFGPRIWPRIKENIKKARLLQPKVLMRARGIGNYGDYYTPENFVPGAPENTDMPWMVIQGLGSSFSFDAVGENYKGTGWILRKLFESVSKGGAFMVGIGPDRTGVFHPEAVRQLRGAGEWLKIYGAAVYATRMYDPAHYQEQHEDHTNYFTASKDGRTVYCIYYGEVHRVWIDLPRRAFAAITLLTPQGERPVPPNLVEEEENRFKVKTGIPAGFKYAGVIKLTLA
ncbi:MAG: alpha-L-fucosidase [Oscillospiraceae bacterium]|jgi:alpha-L-fucosidase|nr:alpha-L-fucosidase [Oscillospiraceae bacterium]